MLNPVVSYAVYAAELFISYVLFSHTARRKTKTFWCILAGLLLFECCSVVNLVCQNNIYINTVLSIAVNFLFALCFFEINRFQALCYSIILHTINFALELVTILALTSILKTDAACVTDNTTSLLIACITSKTLYFLVCLALSRLVNLKSPYAQVPSILFFYPISVIICLSIFWYISGQEGISNSVEMLLALSSVLIFGSTILLFITYQHQIEEYSEFIRLKTENSRLQTEKSYYDILERQNQDLIMYAHDAKNHLAAIQALNDNPSINDYVEKLTNQLKNYSKSCHSGNMMLDVMIHKFSIDCEQHGIRFDYIVRSYNLINMDDIDLVAILGNIMDNAISAARNSQDKHISVETTTRNGYGVLIVCNSCDFPPKIDGNALLTTQKDGYHGYGMKSVSKALKKYDGDYRWRYDEHTKQFYTTIMIGQ